MIRFKLLISLTYQAVIMNNYQVTTTQGVISFQACDSDFAVMEANKINNIGLGNTERVDLILISHDEIKGEDFELKCGSFNLFGAGTVENFEAAETVEKEKLTLSDIKELVSKARDVARREAREVHSCVRSRGAWFKAEKDGENLNESEGDMFTTMKALKSDIAHYKALGADVFWIEGGFDGADSVRELNDGDVSVWIADWAIKLDISLI
jgi:hypothetical protein